MSDTVHLVNLLNRHVGTLRAEGKAAQADIVWQASVEIATLEKQLAALRDLLKQCQWGNGSTCPICGQHIHSNDRGKIVGHMGNCQLAKVLCDA